VKRKHDEKLRRHLLLDLSVFEFFEAVTTLLKTHHSSGDSERVARSLLKKLKDASIGFFGWSSDQGLSVRAHLLCCARKADSLALSCSSSVFRSAARSWRSASFLASKTLADWLFAQKKAVNQVCVSWESKLTLLYGPSDVKEEWTHSETDRAANIHDATAGWARRLVADGRRAGCKRARC